MTAHATATQSPARVVTNVRLYADGMPAKYEQGYLSSFLAMALLLAYTAWVHFMYVLVFMAIFNTTARYVLLGLAATVLLPARPVLWHSFLKLRVWRIWREYFHFSYLFEETLDPSRHYIFGEFPHGVFPLSQLVAGTLVLDIFPGMKIYGMGASSLFYVPGYRHFMAWMGTVDATNRNFKKYLRKGSVAVVPGGIKEIYMQYAEHEKLELRTRKGFVRVAVETGSPIVPVYHFGNTQLLKWWPRSWEKYGRKLRSAVGVAYSRWGLPIPKRVELFMVTGPVIEVPQIGPHDPNFASTVDGVHTKVINAVQELYNRHRAAYGWADRDLVIV